MAKAGQNGQPWVISTAMVIGAEREDRADREVELAGDHQEA